MRSRTMIHTSLLAAAMIASLSGCASNAVVDKEFAEGYRPSKVECLFGGQTETVNAYCNKQRNGVEGELIALNKKAFKTQSPDADCKEHAAMVSALILDADPDLKISRVYSCPEGDVNGVVCHVSVLVTDTTGARYVVDNGAVVKSTVGVGQVATFEAFAERLRGEYWTDDMAFYAGRAERQRVAMAQSVEYRR